MATPKRGGDGSGPLERRAKLGGGRRRERELRIRVSDAEYEEIHKAATRAGLACSAFVIRMVHTAIREQRPLDGALAVMHAELRNASRQVNAVGVNLNQLVRHANAHGEVPESVTWLAEYCFQVVRRTEAVVVELGRRLP
ncbi:plasmid mobilization protein [Actinomadura bangladeshensis]|uniref:MobC family plasmid mobilization relaxosome protein n=1 Tax=Actinomadura bangladeshensis TaxID=453573 RepID=A0A6L9QDE7_9ACTN|nr:plasmid mobilization relaxosome protein MobC [Actinomadura bangladeshensis]NEA23132.1 MobC family plasmid mobilization relaxosome protein [Actinomadura bangladeshensis]